MYPENARPTGQKKFEELESIRGIAALVVVIFHIPKWNGVLDVSVLNNGYLMVDLFFVLSGFVIFNAYADRIVEIRDALRFQFLRFGRLYPVHLLFLALFIGLELVKYASPAAFGAQGVREVPFGRNGLDAIVEQLLLIQAVWPTGNALTFNASAWSVSVEFYTYVIFAAIVMGFRSQKAKVFSAIFVAAVIGLLSREAAPFEGVLRCLAGFSIGCVTASCTNRFRIKVPAYLSFVLLLMMLVFVQMNRKSGADILIYFISAALIGSIVLAPNGWINGVLRNRALVWLGTISYSVYMSHEFVIRIAANVLKRLLTRQEAQGADGTWIVSLSPKEALVSVIAIVAAVLVISQMTFYFVERPLRAASRRIAFDSPAPGQT